MLKVIFIAGAPRSGSTLLGQVLGAQLGHAYVGELSRFLTSSRLRGVVAPCGCGAPVNECLLWSTVLRLHDWSASDRAEQVLRLRNLWGVLAENPGRRVGAAARAVQDTYLRVAEMSQARVIIDTSKHPSNAALCLHMTDLECTVVHLVRDPRSLLHSVEKSKGYLEPSSRSYALAWWIGANLGAEIVLPRCNGVRIRYEDLATDPRDSVERIARTATLGWHADTIVSGNTVVVREQHVLAGNPEPRQVGGIKISYRPAEARGWQGFLAGMVTLPLLRRYGYQLAAH